MVNPKQKNIDPLLNKTPPHDLEAEESLLSAVLIDNDTLLDVVDILKPEDFYKKAHGKIFHAIIELFNRDEPADLVTVATRLKEKDELEDIGGAELSCRHCRCRPHGCQCASLCPNHPG